MNEGTKLDSTHLRTAGMCLYLSGNLDDWKDELEREGFSFEEQQEFVRRYFFLIRRIDEALALWVAEGDVQPLVHVSEETSLLMEANK